MTNILIKTMFMSLSASLIALILFAARPVFKFKLSQTWQYYIWLAVIARLLIPFTPEISMMSSLINLFESAAQIEIGKLDIPTDTASGIALKYISILWFSLSFLFIIKKIISYRIYIRLIEKNREEITDLEILSLQGEVCRKLSLKRNIALYSHKYIESPMLIGFFKPYILLPEMLAGSEKELRYIIKHELVHYQRKDFLYKWLLQIVLCIYFWNPVVWLIKNAVYRSCELSCDEIVIRDLDRSGKKAYGSALLYTLEMSVQYKRTSVVSLMMCEEANHIEERLNAIMQHKKSNYSMLAMSLLLAFAVCFCSVYVGVVQTMCINSNCRCGIESTAYTMKGDT